MKILREFYDCFKNMEKISKITLFCGFCLSFAVYLIAAALFVYYAFFDGDYTTGAYWYNLAAQLSVRILAAGSAPVFVFEILCISRGLKDCGDEKDA